MIKLWDGFARGERALLVLMCWAALVLPARADDVVRGAVSRPVTGSVGATEANPAIARAPSGESIVAWVANPHDYTSELQFQVLNDQGIGIGGGTQSLDLIYVYGGQQILLNVKVAASSTGFLVVFDMAWMSYSSATTQYIVNDWDVFAALLDFQGNVVRAGFLSVLREGYDERDFDVVALDDGSWAVGWIRRDLTAVHPVSGLPLTHGVFVRRLTPGMDPIDGWAVRVDAAAWSVQQQGGLDLAVSGDSLFVTWHDGIDGAGPGWLNSPDGHGRGVLVRVMGESAAGVYAPVTQEIVASAVTSEDQFDPRIDADPAGRVYVAWTSDVPGSGTEVRGAAFDAMAQRQSVGDRSLVVPAAGEIAELSDLAMNFTGELTLISRIRVPMAPGGERTSLSFLRLRRDGSVIESGLVDAPGFGTVDQREGAVAVDGFGDCIVAWQTAPRGATPATGGVAYCSLIRRMLTTSTQVPRLGTTVTINLDSSSDAGLPYLILASTAMGAIPIGQRVLPLAADPLFALSLMSPSYPTLFVRWSGTLDASGRATGASAPELPVPNDPSLSLVEIYLSFVTIAPGEPEGIGNLSRALRMILI